jgi:hypothetical protein
MTDIPEQRGGMGPRGFRGPTGEKGPKGPKGPTGNNGVVDSYWQLNSSSNTLSPINNYSINKSKIVGLQNVDNISDLNKQISTATQAAIDLKINNTDIDNQISSAINNLVIDASSNLNTLKEIANALNNDSQLATNLTNSIELKAPKISPTFTGTVSGITSEMVKPNNIVINSSDLDSSGNFILNSNNLKDGYTIISTSIPSTISSQLVGNGLNDTCYVMYFDKNSNDIYIGGAFYTAYNTGTTTIFNTEYICKYNTVNKNISTIKFGLDYFCRAICAVKKTDNSTDIYIGGDFGGLSYTVKYNWGASTNYYYYSNYLVCYNTGTNLYTAVKAGLQSTCRVLSPIPNSNGSTDIYIGGSFTSAYNTGTTVIPGTRYICKYNTEANSYTAVGAGLDNACYAICSIPNSKDIYIGGTFTSAYNTGTTTIPGTRYICKYNTETGLYSAVGAGLDNACYAICPIPNSSDIYIGGSFTTANNSDGTIITVNRICKYNTVTGLYTAVGAGLQGICYTICPVPNSNDIWIGGSFTSAYNTGTTDIPGTSKICKYNTVTCLYTTLGADLNSDCYALCAVPNLDGSTDMYIGGSFTGINRINGTIITANRICLNIHKNMLHIYYKNTLISSIDSSNFFEVVQKNTISSKEYITLVGNNNTTTNLIF